MNSLSVVVIGKNEEAYINDCLSSVLDAVTRIGDAEIVYVDSASTDRTVEIARSLGVRVISLRPEWKLSPSAGRYVGFHHITGELVMFVDGDTVVDPDWLRCAMPWFDQPEIAGVRGFLDDMDEQGGPLPYVGKRSQIVCEINELCGSGLYRRAAMEQEGTFNPHLIVEEESELGLRLRRAGWKLLHLPCQMGSHRRGGNKMAQIKRAWRLGRVHGNGLTWRYACREDLGFQFCFQRFRPTMMFALMCLLLSPGLFLSFAGYTRIAGFFLGPLLAWMASVVIKKRSLSGLVDYISFHTLALFGLFVGAMRARLEEPQKYPLDVIEILGHSATASQEEVNNALPHTVLRQSERIEHQSWNTQFE
jgi:glycosyltransferase involved in cell wall biosynthesis